MSQDGSDINSGPKASDSESSKKDCDSPEGLLESERVRNRQLNDQVERLDTALHLMKVDHRMAEIRVVRQGLDPETQKLWSEIEFVEVSEEGREIGEPKQFTFEGDKVYIDYWVVKFADHYVEQAALHRATSICLFRGIHGEYQSPAEAFRLDSIGDRPPAYARGKALTDFEKEIWSDFWEFANNPHLAWQKGIRAAHGEEPYMAIREGMTYRVELRASDGLSIVPIAPNGLTDVAPLSDAANAPPARLGSAERVHSDTAQANPNSRRQ